MNLRLIFSSVVLGYMIAIFCYQHDPQVAEWIIYQLIPFGIALDNAYIALQALQTYLASKPDLLVDPTLHTAAQKVYVELLPILGYDFLSQFDNIELLLFYLQSINNNIELSLDLFLTNASIQSQGIIPFLSLSLAVSNRKQELFYSIKIQNCVGILVYIENVRTNFTNFYLKRIKNLLLKIRLRRIFKLQLTK